MNTMKTERAEARKVSPLTRLVLVVAATSVAALGIAALVGLATGGLPWEHAGGGGAAVDERKAMDLAGVDLLSVEGVSEDVQIIEATGNGAEAWLHGTASSGSAANTPRLEVDRSGSTLNVHVYPDRTFGFDFYYSKLVLEVSVPADYAQKLSVHTVSGRLQVADHRADRGYAALDLSSTSGDVEAGSVNASQFAVHTTSGSIAAAGVAAKTVSLSSVSGSIRMASVAAAEEAGMHTTSGDMNVTYTVAPARTDASSTSGNVTLKLPPGAAFKLDARSTSGDITCDFPITISKRSSGGGMHSLVGDVGAGTSVLTVHTTSGDIRIK
jgi:lia operon protein LiaG